VDAGIWVGIASGVIALLALTHSFLATRSERHDREEQIRLLREQRDEGRLDRDERRRAELHAEQEGSGGGEVTDSYDFSVRNTGPATARDLEGQARTAANEIVARQEIPPIMAGGTAPVHLDIPRHLSRSGRLRFFLVWLDGDGVTVQDSLEIRRFTLLP
jgi:hypothetical protein